MTVSGGRLPRMPDGRYARVDGQPACRLPGCCYTADAMGEMCERHRYAAHQRRIIGLELRTELAR